MSLVLADRVRETTTSTGTGTITLGGAVTGFQSFSVIGNNNTTYYTIAGTSQWEVGIGTYYGGTLTRDTVLSSSTGSKIDFSAGSKDVFVTYPAGKSVNEDANNRVLIPYTSGTTNVGSLNVGNATGHTDSGVIAGFTASEPLYLYTSLQNTSSANTSYASYAVNDGGHTAYGELGINNANYSYSAAGFPNNGFSTPLASFVESYGGPLVLGSWDSQKISFIVNGAVSTTDAMTINTNGSVAFNGQVGTAGQVLQSNATSAPTWVTPSSSGGLTWAAVQTANFTASAGSAYPVNTTSGAITVTLPASPTAGQLVTIVDYAGTSLTNNITVSSNGNKIQGSTDSVVIVINRQAYNFVYIDATQGWLSYAQEYVAVNQPFSASYLITAGGGGGAIGGGGAGGYLSGSQTITVGTVYTVVIGAGGGGSTSFSGSGASGTNSTLTGITAAIGGGGVPVGANGLSGGSGGGGDGSDGIRTGGAGTSGQGNAGGANNFIVSPYSAGGGGGAGAVGGSSSSSTVSGNGGNGSITTLITTTQATSASVGQVSSGSVYFSGGGGAGIFASGGTTAGTGGLGGGGAGSKTTGGSSANANTGGGGGGGYQRIGGNGGSGCVLISIATANYSGTTTGSPTVVTNGSNTVMIFKSSGSYTG